MAYYELMISQAPITVIETPSFMRDAKRLLSEDERQALIDYMAYNPTAGDLVQGTGGVRKLRWARENEGKSSGYRIIYFFHSDAIPLFALNVFAKNEKVNISAADKNELKKLTAILVSNYVAGD
jgi:hypothetical protein